MLYIVYITIAHHRHDEWLAWMREVHVPDVVATGCFVEAVVARDASRDTQEGVAYRIAYRAESEEHLARYQREHAPRLQRDHSSRYEGDFEASREILPVVVAIGS